MLPWSSKCQGLGAGGSPSLQASEKVLEEAGGEQGSEGWAARTQAGQGARPARRLGGGAVLITVLLGRLVVLLAHQPSVLHEVELVPRGQLPVTDDAGEAVQVVDEVLRLPDHLGRGDALLAGRAFCAEAPVRAVWREKMRARGREAGSGLRALFICPSPTPPLRGVHGPPPLGHPTVRLTARQFTQGCRIFQVPLSGQFRPLPPGFFSLMVRPRGPAPRGNRVHPCA